LFSPAEYVAAEIANETNEERDKRIHEQCVVLKIGTGETWVMLTGDADRDAWEQRITDYHAERLPATVLSAPHHGSRTFFLYEEDDDPYLDALNTIDPTYVVISAPTSEESPYDHPHEIALDLYADHVGSDNVLHTGRGRCSYICDVHRDGRLEMTHDDGQLAAAYECAQDGQEQSASASTASMSLAKPRYIQVPAWPVDNVYHVGIDGYLYAGKNMRKLGGIRSDGRILSSGLWLKFLAKTRAPKEHEVFWQVVNTGRHAEQENGVRGTIFQGSSTQWEQTLYTGKHWIECFIVQNGVCIGRSGRFYVNIRNPGFQ